MSEAHELDQPVTDAPQGKEDSPVEEAPAATYCYYGGKPYKVGARLCWGGTVQVCHKDGTWTNTGKKC